jgi:hypothetical protein
MPYFVVRCVEEGHRGIAMPGREDYPHHFPLLCV